MIERIRTAAKLKSFLEGLVAEESITFERLCAARAEGSLRHFMSFNSCDYHIAVVRSDMASRYIAFLNEERTEEDGSVMTDESKLAIIAEEVSKNVLHLNTRIVSRSTSMNANLAEDAERMFWVDMFQSLNGGY